MNKTLKIILIILLVIIVAIGGIGFALIRSVLYPDVLISGTGEKKVVCVGDSITYSQGVLTTRDTESYPAILATLLGDEYQTYNFGLCNRTLLSSGNMPYTNEDFATESLTIDADIVIIMLGTNDSKPANWNAGQYEAEYVQFVQNYQNMESAPEVYIMLPPRVFLEDTDDGNCNDATLKNEVIPAIERVAAQTGAKLIDLYAVTEEHPEWFSDGLHPNAAGNQAIAQAICEQITSDLEMK
ncbi:MAG: hypothetical protein IJZ23_05060 [Roseburia sp.]|nr:hypothetical protein [Roseburia sp.]